MARGIVERILEHNRGRDAELLSRKFARMRADPFAFFRGSCHLFYEDWLRDELLDRSPNAWICGDLHIENFGVYKGDNRLVYFDLNDFDESTRAPCTWELARFATSVRLAATALGLSETKSTGLVERFFTSYRNTLSEGKSRWVERATAQGPIGDLLKKAADRSRPEFLDRRTELKRGKRKLIVDGEHALPAAPDRQKAIARLVQSVGAATGQEDFFEPLDVARRVAGTGSLGVDRYVILLRGKGSPDHNYLVDLKLALPSAPGQRLRKVQPRWADEAQRIVAVQRRAQAISQSMLTAVEFEHRGFVLRELQPSEDRLGCEHYSTEDDLKCTLDTMGQVVAWSHLRSSGRQGAAIADEWIAFAGKERWVHRILDYSRDYRERVERDWRNFSQHPA
jgi:uncharacterized protein (DUF2252 family)